MANNISQKKRNRQNEKRRQTNQSLMSDLKTSIKKVETALAAGEPTDVLYRDAQKKIDGVFSCSRRHLEGTLRESVLSFEPRASRPWPTDVAFRRHLLLVGLAKSA